MNTTRPASFAPLATIDQTGPDLAVTAHDAWRDAERLYREAEDRAYSAGGDGCVFIPAVKGEPRRAGTDAEIDRVIDQELRVLACAGARWITDGYTPEKIARIREGQEAARRYIRPDAAALKAQLRQNKACRAAAMKAEDVDALEKAEAVAWTAFLDTEADTAASIALKLRADSEATDSAYVGAALRDLDRIAREGARMATQGRQAPEGQGRVQTEVERLHARYVEALRDADESDTDEILNRLSGIANEAHRALLEAQPVTLRDVALQVLIYREHIEEIGMGGQCLVAQLDQMAA